jgi:multimeric flavodoxin WrbA
MTIKRAVLLIGSPKGGNSSSASLGSYLLSKLEKYDIETETVHLHSEIRTEAKQTLFLEKVEEADLIILAAPLYVDTLPAKVIKALSLIADQRKKLYVDDIKSAKNQSFAAVVNCGFPEAEQNKTALKVYEEFAREAKLKYLGGIAVGMGGAVSGKALSEMGGMAKDLIEGLDQAADDIVRNHQLSNTVIEKTSKPLISQKWLYTLVGNLNWRFQAFKNGVYRKINDQPYKGERLND